METEEDEEPSDTETLALHLRTLGVQKEIQEIILTAIKDGCVSFDVIKKLTSQFSRKGTSWLIALLENYNVAILHGRGIEALQDCRTYPDGEKAHLKQVEKRPRTKKGKKEDITYDHGQIRFYYKGQWYTRLQEAEWSNGQGVIVPITTAIAIEQAYQHEEG